MRLADAIHDAYDYRPHIAYLRQRLGDTSPALDRAAILPVIALLEREPKLQAWIELLSTSGPIGARLAGKLRAQLETPEPAQEPETPWYETPDPFA